MKRTYILLETLDPEIRLRKFLRILPGECSVSHVDLPNVDRLVNQQQHDADNDEDQQRARNDHARQLAIQHTTRLVSSRCSTAPGNMVTMIGNKSSRFAKRTNKGSRLIAWTEIAKCQLRVSDALAAAFYSRSCSGISGYDESGPWTSPAR